jgi:hypothetical protein
VGVPVMAGSEELLALDGLDIAEKAMRHVRHSGPCQMAVAVNLERKTPGYWSCSCGAAEALAEWNTWKGKP